MTSVKNSATTRRVRPFSPPSPWYAIGRTPKTRQLSRDRTRAGFGPYARIVLTPGGGIRARHGRYLAVQALSRSGWTGSAAGGITPDGGWGPDGPRQAWSREGSEESGIAVVSARSLGVVV